MPSDTIRLWNNFFYSNCYEYCIEKTHSSHLLLNWRIAHYFQGVIWDTEKRMQVSGGFWQHPNKEASLSIIHPQLACPPMAVVSRRAMFRCSCWHAWSLFSLACICTTKTMHSIHNLGLAFDHAVDGIFYLLNQCANFPQFFLNWLIQCDNFPRFF